MHRIYWHKYKYVDVVIEINAVTLYKTVRKKYLFAFSMLKLQVNFRKHRSVSTAIPLAMEVGATPEINDCVLINNSWFNIWHLPCISHIIIVTRKYIAYKTENIYSTKKIIIVCA